MAKRHEITIGGMVFGTKKEAKKFFMDMLEPLSIGHRLTKTEFDLIYGLLRFGRSEANLKMGGGIESMYVDDNTYNGRCFHIRRFDGSIDGVSVVRCISGQASSMGKFTQATRKSVDPDVIAFRNWHRDNAGEGGLLTCAITGQRIPREQANVDHAYPMTFNVIRDAFIFARSLSSAGFDIDSIEYKDEYGYAFVDRTLAEAFRVFHEAWATLRIIRKDYNVGAGKSDPRLFAPVV